jgi:type II secretory pathway pseudopilin PulG
MLTRLTAVVRPDGDDDEAGFSLVEIVIALTVLMVLATAVSITLLDGLQISKLGRQRVAASNLAAREAEIVRNQFSSSDASALAVAAAGAVDNANPLSGSGPSVVDGTAYTVHRDVQWLPTGNGDSACDGGSLVNHPSLRVTVSVTWPDMGSAKPVRVETLLTPPKGTLGSTTIAFVAAKVQNAAGLAAPGVTVEATGPGGSFTHTTDGSGCAVFQVGAAGTYTIVMNMSGWVDQTGAENSTKTTVVSAGQLARMSLTYDRAASMDISLVADSEYPIPSPLPAVNYLRPNVPESSARQVLNSLTMTTRVSGLWPQTDGYAAWSGGCNDSDPAGVPTSGSRSAPVVIGPGAVGVVEARLAPVDITVATDTGATVAGAAITATSLNCPTTAADRQLTLGTTDATGHLKVSLPYGQWQLETTYLSKTMTGPMTPAATGVTTYLFEVA